MAKQSVLPQKIIVEYMQKKNGELPKFVMNSKMEVKLGQLLKICPQLREMMTKSMLKMEEAQITNVCKITTIKIKDFDEAILVVQVRVGKFGSRKALLDDKSGVNIIFKSLRKKLGLRKPEPTFFIVRVVDQKKVQLVELMRNLKIDLARCEYKISHTPKLLDRFNSESKG
jgi:dsDNA-binding SOS-regulon protein